MVNLPRPSAFASSSSIDILPRANVTWQLPAPSTAPCCYQFGLEALPQEAEASLDTNVSAILNRLLILSQLLATPTLFGRGDGHAWTHSEQHFPTLLQWREQQVPALLAQVEQLLQQLATSDIPSGSHSGSQWTELVLGHVVCAVARYLPPNLVVIDSTSAPTNDESLQDGWTSSITQSKSNDIFSTLRRGSAQDKLPAPSTIATALLTDYIKPIFRETASSSSASTSSVNADTGRKNPPPAGSLFVTHLDAHLGQHRFGSADQDSDAVNLAPRRFAFSLSPATLRTHTPPGSEAGLQTLVERNEALGCTNVLSWCLDAVRLESESDWSAVWPLIVPPLLTLLEHAQPRFRLRGSVLVHRLLLRPTAAEQGADGGKGRRQAVLGALLVRTGIGSLLERALHVNLTYVDDERYAPALLHHSIGALRQLILLTTRPIAYVQPTHAPHEVAARGTASPGEAQDDCGKRCMEALLRLVSEAVLSTWSYLPLPAAGTRLGRELVRVTCAAYVVLADDLAPPCGGLGGVARFLDVSLDWICRSWLGNVAFDNSEQVDVTVAVIGLANRLLFPSGPVQSSDARPPRRFTGLVLSSVAKCWISALESHLRESRLRWDEVQHGLSGLLVKLEQVDSTVEARWSELVKLDQRLKVLLPPH